MVKRTGDIWALADLQPLTGHLLLIQNRRDATRLYLTEAAGTARDQGVRFAVGFLFPYLQPTGTSSLEYLSVPVAYALGIALLSLLFCGTVRFGQKHWPAMRSMTSAALALTLLSVWVEQ